MTDPAKTLYEVTLPACCRLSDDAQLAETLYCCFNWWRDVRAIAADPAWTPCLTWEELDPDVAEQWERRADLILELREIK
uniref:Uncharacterized protein n=1 Tax=viral metagenome TaxID=1070528 RepID=A0A6M3M0D0_9ZZZZ